MNTERLLHLRRKADYYRQDAPDWLKVIYDTPGRFNWMVKHHKTRLVEAGVLVKIGRDLFVDAEAFPETVKTIIGVQEGQGVAP